MMTSDTSLKQFLVDLEATDADCRDGNYSMETIQQVAATRLAQVEELESKARAWDDINGRSDEAHAYCQRHLIPKAWGQNVWHAVLTDAIDMRAAALGQTQESQTMRERAEKLAGEMMIFGRLKGSQRDGLAACLVAFAEAELVFSSTRLAPQQEPAWQPIATAPTDETRVLLYNPDEGNFGWGIQSGAYYEQLGGWQYDGQRPMYSNAHQPTHWQPLPVGPPVASSRRETQEPS